MKLRTSSAVSDSEITILTVELLLVLMNRSDTNSSSAFTVSGRLTCVCD